MKVFSVITVFLAVGLRVASAQDGYNYDRPQGGRPSAPGFGGNTQGNYPAAATTPSYQAPAFGNQAPGGGYNYPSQSDTDFPTASVPTGGAAGYPSGPQQGGRPQGFSPQGPTGTGAGQPYPAAGQPSGPYPAQGQPGQRPGVIGTGPAQGAFAGTQPGAGSFAQPGAVIPGAAIPGVSAVAGSPALGGSAIGGQGNQQDENQEGDYSAIPGEPEIDYPIYSEIPETSFDCTQQEFPGYYADVEARCQVFHVCAFNNTRKFDFLCPNGTIFSQEFLVCVWWNQFDCNSAPGLFANNANLYEGPQGAQQGNQASAQAGPGVANDFAAATGPSGPYPAPAAAGRPGQNTGFGVQPGTPSTAYGPPPQNTQGFQPSGPTAAAGYPAAGAPTGAGNYPTGPQAFNPSTTGPYPSAGANIPNVPSTGYQPPQQGPYPSQNDAPYPSGPSTGTTPPRDYLPPRRG